MKVLVVEDDWMTRLDLESYLRTLGYEVHTACDGESALETLQAEDAPALVILDWLMPGLSGLEVCRKVREAEAATSTYIIMLTVKNASEDVIAGLEAGADDFVSKPFVREELRARLNAGARIIALQDKLAGRVAELERALSQIKRLEGLLPICSYCKSIRDGEEYWHEVENYISKHTEALFSHSVCPNCMVKFVEPQIENLRRAKLAQGKPEDPRADT